jgi:hypothetical protein
VVCTSLLSHFIQQSNKPNNPELRIPVTLIVYQEAGDAVPRVKITFPSIKKTAVTKTPPEKKPTAKKPTKATTAKNAAKEAPKSLQKETPEPVTAAKKPAAKKASTKKTKDVVEPVTDTKPATRASKRQKK